MTAYRLDIALEESQCACGQIGGSPHLPESTEWPRCRICDSELIAFLEVKLPNDHSTPFQKGSLLQIFACREHDDIAGTIYTDYRKFDASCRSLKLPTDYWTISDGHYLLRLLPPWTKTSQPRKESRLDFQRLTATYTDDELEHGFKLFGQPYWLQDAETHQCACGAPMRLLMQIPESYGFRMAEGAEEQPNSFSTKEYCIFLGNQIYLLACTKQCHPQALWPVMQN